MNIKNWYLLIFFCLVSFPSFSQNTFIPDDNFEQAIIDLGLDSPPLDNFVPTANIIDITYLDLNLKNITDLRGIEDFKKLLILDCSRNLLTNFDVSQNSELTELYCHGNQLTAIDVTKNSKLKILWCYTNALPSIDVSKNTNIISLVCWENNLTNINITNNKEIVVFGCETNNISSLDLSNNPKLSRFQCRGNLLSELDVSNNPNLSYFDCGENILKNLDLVNNPNLNTLLCSNNELIELDVSKNTVLRNLECKNNKLCSLIVNNGNNDDIAFMDFTYNPNLNCVVVDSASGDHSLWEPQSFSNYANSIDQCGNFIPVDQLDDFIGNSYTLPLLNNGNYYTKSGGLGQQLYPGNIIKISQHLYIYVEVGCINNESSFNIIINTDDYFIPKYFTPNNDSENDFWKVTDNSNIVNNISIYDRYGKLIKFILPNTPGWDGNFNGKPLKTDSYWYEIVLNTNEILTGYFALKR